MIAFAKSLAVVFKGRAGYGRSAETWMAVDVGRAALGDVTAAGIKAVVEAALGKLTVGRRRRSCCIDDGAVGAAGKSQRKRDHSEQKGFPHGGDLAY